MVRVFSSYVFIVCCVLNFFVASLFGIDLHLLKGQFKSHITQYRLSNGLRVIFFKRDVAPIFSGIVTIRVGGVDETYGKTGISHMLEHMAFKGTDVIGTKDYKQEKKLLEILDKLMGKENLTKEDKAQLVEIKSKLSKLWVINEFPMLYEQMGAYGLNATTGKEFTNYFVSLPKDSFEFWCYMESSRIANPVFRQFYKERDVVLQEKYMRYDNNPEGKLWETLLSLAFIEHPYHFPVIGYKRDLLSLSPQDLVNLHNMYYVPSNMVLAIVGDIVPEEGIKIVKKYFSRLRKDDASYWHPDFNEPPQFGERVTDIEDGERPNLIIAYKKPSFPHPDDAAISLLLSYLGDGKVSLIYKELVKKRKLALSVSTFEGPGYAYNNLGVIQILPKNFKDQDLIVREIQVLINKVAQGRVDKRALEVIKRRMIVDFIKQLENNVRLGIQLAQAELIYGGWQSIIDWFAMIKEVRASDLKRVASKYFTVRNRTVGKLVGRR